MQALMMLLRCILIDADVFVPSSDIFLPITFQLRYVAVASSRLFLSLQAHCLRQMPFFEYSAVADYYAHALLTRFRGVRFLLRDTISPIFLSPSDAFADIFHAVAFSAYLQRRRRATAIFREAYFLRFYCRLLCASRRRLYAFCAAAEAQMPPAIDAQLFRAYFTLPLIFSCLRHALYFR